MRKSLYALAIGITMTGAVAPQAWAYDRDSDIKKVEKGLENQAVRDRLKALGLTEKDIESRMERLSDKQIHQLAKKTDAIAPGGDIGILGFILLIVLLVILL